MVVEAQGVHRYCKVKLKVFVATFWDALDHILLKRKENSALHHLLSHEMLACSYQLEIYSVYTQRYHWN